MKIIYHRKFAKQFAKLPTNAKARFRERRSLFVNDSFHPQLNNHSVERSFPGCRSINVTGDFRAIFKEEGEVVTFTNIGTHSDLYG